MPTMVYFRTAKTASTSIISFIRNSGLSYGYVKGEADLSKTSKYVDIIIVEKAAKPDTDTYRKIVEWLEVIPSQVKKGVKS